MPHLSELEGCAPCPKKIDPEVKARAVRLVTDHQSEYPSLDSTAWPSLRRVSMNPSISGCGGRVPREENGSPTENFVVLLQPPDLGLERLDLGQILTRRALALPAVYLGLDHPAAHGLSTDAELFGDRRRRSGQAVLRGGQ